MGNTITSTQCFQLKRPKSSSSSSGEVKLIFWEGTTTSLSGKNNVAREIMFENPDKMLCDEDTFFIGQQILALSNYDPLLPGSTYFILPLDRFVDRVLTTPSLASLTSSPTRTPVHFGGVPFLSTPERNKNYEQLVRKSWVRHIFDIKSCDLNYGLPLFHGG